MPEQLLDHFSEFSPLFVLGEVPESQIPEHMKEYKVATGRKTISQSKKPLGVLRVKKDFALFAITKMVPEPWTPSHKNLQVSFIFS